jgi:hypothetical protein
MDGYELNAEVRFPAGTIILYFTTPPRSPPPTLVQCVSWELYAGVRESKKVVDRDLTVRYSMCAS